MTKERFLKNHKKTYDSLQSKIKLIVVMLGQAEAEYNKSIKKFSNGSLKRKRKELSKQEELQRFVKNITAEGDKIYKILNTLTA